MIILPEMIGFNAFKVISKIATFIVLFLESDICWYSSGFGVVELIHQARVFMFHILLIGLRYISSLNFE